jgi:hypothetical protein
MLTKTTFLLGVDLFTQHSFAGEGAGEHTGSGHNRKSSVRFLLNFLVLPPFKMFYVRYGAYDCRSCWVRSKHPLTQKNLREKDEAVLIKVQSKTKKNCSAH